MFFGQTSEANAARHSLASAWGDREQRTGSPPPPPGLGLCRLVRACCSNMLRSWGVAIQCRKLMHTGSHLVRLRAACIQTLRKKNCVRNALLFLTGSKESEVPNVLSGTPPCEELKVTCAMQPGATRVCSAPCPPNDFSARPLFHSQDISFY